MAKASRGGASKGAKVSAPLELALLANGASGRWSVTLDESIAGAEEWFLQIEGPSLHLSCEVSGPEILSDLAATLLAQTPAPDRLVGKSQGVPLWLRPEGEGEETFTFLVGEAAGPLVRYSIHGADVRALAEALEQAVGDLR